MIGEAGLLVAFFIGLTVGYFSRSKRPKTYELREFNGIKS